ncbi:MAG: TadE family protein [Pseudomonadota bacterium]
MSREKSDRPSVLRRLAFWRRGVWRGDRDGGNATVEFVIIFPVFMAVFLSTFEIGLYMTRQVMLDRATDLTVRALRLGQFEPPEGSDGQLQMQELLRTNICNRAAVIDNCSNRLLIEMTKIPTTTWTTLRDGANCVDREEDANPVIEPIFDVGVPNDLMVIRVCALVEPFFVTTRLAMKMPTSNGKYALVTKAAFVIEPEGG